MSDKKNEDFVVRMPEGSDAGEKDPFIARTVSHAPVQQQSLSNSMHKIDNNPGISILAYCLASISMTVVNKYVVSGSAWNMNFFYLAIQVSTPLGCRGASRGAGSTN